MEKYECSSSLRSWVVVARLPDDRGDDDYLMMQQEREALWVRNPAITWLGCNPVMFRCMEYSF